MSPIDDELRSLFSDRADGLSPAPDSFPGIERRARRMRRNRMAASVAGTALAVAAIAVAVPALLPDRVTDGRSSQFATSSPSAPASPGPSRTQEPASDGALDPQHPWSYRGNDAAISGTELTTLKSEWSTVHPGATLTPLYGEIYESSQQPQVTFVSTGGGADRWGVAAASASGWTWLHDEPLAPGTKALMAALPADEVPRLQIVAAPTTGQLLYAKDAVHFAPLTSVAPDDPGVAYTALQGDTSHDAVKVLDGNGDSDHPVFEGPAPDFQQTSVPNPPPANYLAWQPRGTVDTALEQKAVAAFATAKGTRAAAVGHRVLWGGKDAAGRGLVFLEAWAGGPAQTFGFVDGGEVFLGPVLATNPPLLAYDVSGTPGSSTETLVLLPRPGAGPFSYAASSTAPYRPVGNARSDLGNVAVIDRDPRATSDRVKVLDGDAMQVLYDGPVQPLLCGTSGCG